MRYWGGDSTLQMVCRRSELSTVFHHTGLTTAGLLRTFKQNQNISTLKMLNKIYQNEMFDLFPQSWHLCWLLIPSRCEDCGLRPSVTMLGSHSLTDNINSPSPVVTRVTPQGETRLSHQSSSCVMWCGEAWPVIWSYNEWRTLQLNRVKRSRCV